MADQAPIEKPCHAPPAALIVAPPSGPQMPSRRAVSRGAANVAAPLPAASLESRGDGAARPKSKAEPRARANSNSKGKQRRPARPAPRGGDNSGIEREICVAELATIICRDPGRRKKRLKLAEAMRECGLDEPKIAETHFALLHKLSLNTYSGAAGIAAAKLLLDLVKDIVHSLEPQKVPLNGETGDAAPLVRFIHDVPGPVRPD